MFIDSQLLFSDAQAVTVDTLSTNTLDLGVAKNLFDGEPLALILSVDTAADFTTTDETYAIQFRTSVNSDMSSATTISTTNVTNTQLAKAKFVILPLPVGVTTQRYIALYYDVGGTTPSVTLTAFLQPLSMMDKYRFYADNSVIS